MEVVEVKVKVKAVVMVRRRKGARGRVKDGKREEGDQRSGEAR